MPGHVVAVDWSGALAGARRRIWLAEVRDGTLVRLEDGRERAEVVADVVETGLGSPSLVVGLDFAFGFPAWWTREQGCADAPALWAHAAREGERWLSACEPPFWGRPGRGRAIDVERAFRRAERDVRRIGGIAPKSVFQVGGAGAVGTGSIRGMPHLLAFHDAGFRLWPFDPPVDDERPVVVEIWPRLLTGAVNKSSFAERAEYLRHRFATLPAALGVVAASSEDAFDAAVSAMVMAEHVDQLRALPDARDDVERLEGAIWAPW